MQSGPFVHPATIHFYVDGSHRPPDATACAYVAFSERTKHVLAMEMYAMRGSTINQAELMAINLALDYPGLKYAYIHSDSAYAISCLSVWRKAWALRDWMTPAGEPVKNRDLIEEIGAKIDALKFVKFVKVKAHTGDPFNSIADYLATSLTAKLVTDSNINVGRVPIIS